MRSLVIAAVLLSVGFANQASAQYPVYQQPVVVYSGPVAQPVYQVPVYQRPAYRSFYRQRGYVAYSQPQAYSQPRYTTYAVPVTTAPAVVAAPVVAAPTVVAVPRRTFFQALVDFERRKNAALRQMIFGPW